MISSISCSFSSDCNLRNLRSSRSLTSCAARCSSASCLCHIPLSSPSFISFLFPEEDDFRCDLLLDFDFDRWFESFLLWKGFPPKYYPFGRLYPLAWDFPSLLVLLSCPLLLAPPPIYRSFQFIFSLMCPFLRGSSSTELKRLFFLDFGACLECALEEAFLVSR